MLVRSEKEKILEMSRRMGSHGHIYIYVMYLTPAEPTFLFFSIILTNPIVQYMSHAKPRRESNPNLGTSFPLYSALQVSAP